MSKKTFSQKVRKNNERAKNREKRIAATRAAFMAENYEKLAGYMKPDENAVIFKGLNMKVLEELKPVLVANAYDHTALSNFYTEFKNDKGKTVKVRFANPMAPCSPSDLLLFIKDFYKDRRRGGWDVEDTLEILSDCDENSFLATFFIEYEGLITMGYTVGTKHGIVHSILVDTANVLDSLKAEATAHSKHQKSKKEQDKVELDRIHAKNTLFEAMCVLGLYSIYAIQYIVCCYLEGKKLPKLAIGSDSVTTPKTPRSSHASSAQKGPADKDPNNCVAYIYYDCKDGSVSISGSRNYSMRWWIVSGHKRHYLSGKIVDIPPYIKGDKDDPDAQRALKVFTETHQRIQCYKLVRR